MTIRINPEVFNTHKAYDNLTISAQDAAARLEDFAHKLVRATEIHDDGARAFFQVIDFDMGEDADSVKDFGVYAQNVTNDAGDVDQTSLMDLSFGVQKDQHHLMQAACLVRPASAMAVDQDTGALTMERSNAGLMIVGADFADELGNTLFSWVFDHIPDEDRAQFLQNCEDMGLIDAKPTIGFGTLLPQTEQNTPSMH